MSQTISTASQLGNVSSRQASNTAIAYAILRLSFGANILLHGLSRVLNGRPAFLAYLTKYFEHAHLISPGMLPIFGAVLPWVETTLGLLLMLGLFSRFTLIVGRSGDDGARHRHKPGAGLAGRGTAAAHTASSITIYLIHLEENTYFRG